MKRAATAAESRHLSRVAGLGCILCRHMSFDESPCEIHHPREDEGGAQRGGHFVAIGLCREHHQGDSGIHMLGKARFFARYHVDEMDLLNTTLQLLYGGR